jgi:hypothetical protein
MVLFKVAFYWKCIVSLKRISQNLKILYFQFTAEICCSMKRKSLYVSLQVVEQNKLNFTFSNDHNTQDITQVNNLDI